MGSSPPSLTWRTPALICNDYPYQSINSGAFYKKINSVLRENKNIKFFKNINEVNVENSFVFNSVPLPIENNDDNLWQHFCGIEIETKSNIFDDTIINLMDFDCDQGESVHFFYTLPYSKNKALVETTWLSKMSNNEKNYDKQLQNYIETNLKIKNFYHVRVQFKKNKSNSLGLLGSNLVIINPPFGIEPKLDEVSSFMENTAELHE